MPNVQIVLNEEMHRIARKEIKSFTAPLLKTVSEMKRQIHELQTQLKQREAALQKFLPEEPVEEKKAEEPKEKKFRLTPARITKLRVKLGLSKKQFADLLGVNFVSVFNWEKGKSIPRQQQKARIAAVRAMGKRELAAALKTKNIIPVEKKKA